MSRNFELLQQIGNDEELFRTAVQPEEASSAPGCSPGSALDQETFETLMEKATVMGLFQTSDEPSQQTLTKVSDDGIDRGAENVSTKAADVDAPKAFGTPRNTSSRIGDVDLISEAHIGLSATDSHKYSLPSAFPVAEKPKVIPGPTIESPRPDARLKSKQSHRQNRSITSPWLDSIKSAAKRWEWKERARSTYGGADLEAITREEEIKLVQRVFPGATPESPRIALFAGLGKEAGCASTCARVAELLAARGEGPVCAVDANFQTPSLHKYFSVDNLKGLAEATVEPGPIQSFAQQIPEPDLWLIPSGNAAAQLRFPAMADGLRVRIEELREAFKYVVIHSGPLRLETSAMLLSRWTDGVVLVVEANATRRDAARRVKEMLDNANVRLLGVILNNRTFPIPDAIYRRLY